MCHLREACVRKGYHTVHFNSVKLPTAQILDCSTAQQLGKPRIVDSLRRMRLIVEHASLMDTPRKPG
jgi:hypothetical protein